jgi:hypothetical protein
MQKSMAVVAKTAGKNHLLKILSVSCINNNDVRAMQDIATSRTELDLTTNLDKLA